MSDHRKNLVEQHMRTLQQKMPEAAWTAISAKIDSFLASLLEKDEIWLTPSMLTKLVTKLPLADRDALFRGILKFARPLASGGYHIEQILERPKVLAIAVTVLIHGGESVLEKPKIVD